jgi:hypothetical protein
MFTVVLNSQYSRRVVNTGVVSHLNDQDGEQLSNYPKTGGSITGKVRLLDIFVSTNSNST